MPVGEHEVACADMRTATAKDPERALNGIGAQPCGLTEKPEDPLRPGPPLYRQPHAMQFAVEDEHLIAVDERHGILYDDPFVTECAARMREKNVSDAVRTGSILPDRAHGAILFPAIRMQQGIPPSMPLVLTAVPAHTRECIQMRPCIDGRP